MKKKWLKLSDGKIIDINSITHIGRNTYGEEIPRFTCGGVLVLKRRTDYREILKAMGLNDK